MIPSFIILSLIYLSVVGYSIFLKRFFFNKNINLDFYNLDFFYGISFIILLGCLINFFLPLKVFSNFIILNGFLLFLFFYNKTNFKFNIKIIFILIFFFLFISASHNQVGDSAWYHLQNIKWVSNFKISFGLANLEPRYAYNSLIYLGGSEWAEKNWPMVPIPPHATEGPNYHFIWRAHAYSIDPPLAKNLLAHVLKMGICAPLDIMMRTDLFNVCHRGLIAFDKSQDHLDTTIKARPLEGRTTERNDKLDY